MLLFKVRVHSIFQYVLNVLANSRPRFASIYCFIYHNAANSCYSATPRSLEENTIKLEVYMHSNTSVLHVLAWLQQHTMGIIDTMRRLSLDTYRERQGRGDATLAHEITAPAAFAPSTSVASHDPLSLSLLPPLVDPSPFTLSSPATPAPPILTPTSHPTSLNCPRPMPSTFLHPDPIVPLRVSRYNMQPDHLHRSQTPRQGLVCVDHRNVPPVLIWLVIITFAIIAAATAWCAIVCLIYLHRNTVGLSAQSKGRGKSRIAKEHWRAWLVRSVNLFAREGRSSALHSKEEADRQTTALTSAHDVPMQSKHYTSLAYPQLVPPNQPLLHLRNKIDTRTLGELSVEHRAFFLGSASANVTPSVPRSHGLGSSHSLSSAELEDVELEAREAQGRRFSYGHEAKYEIPNGGASTSWVDLGLAMVDGAVDRVAAGIVRWADDNDEDDELVLPLAKNKADRF